MDWRIVIPVSGLILGVLGLLHQLIVKRKDATIEGLQTENARLQRLLDEANKASPDVLAERYKKKIDRLESELIELQNETATNVTTIEEKRLAIEAKEKELETVRIQIEELTEQMGTANELLTEELEFIKSQIDSCPQCGAELREKTTVPITLGEYEDFGTYTEYDCGYAELDGVLRHPCSKDPNYPTIDDYNLVTEYQENDALWMCYARPKTRMSVLIHLRAISGRTAEEARANVIEASRSYLKKH